jgi:hypothetical protein
MGSTFKGVDRGKAAKETTTSPLPLPLFGERIVGMTDPVACRKLILKRPSVVGLPFTEDLKSTSIAQANAEALESFGFGFKTFVPPLRVLQTPLSTECD